MRYEVVRRKFARQEMNLVRIPDGVWDEALRADRARQSWHGPRPKSNHWAGRNEQILGNGGEIMMRLFLEELGLEGWQSAPIFNDKFHQPVDRGGSPSWDVAFGSRVGEWRTVSPDCEPGWFGVARAGEVKVTGPNPPDAWVMRVKEREYKPHPRLVFFATVMVSLKDPTLGGAGDLRFLPRYMFPFHYITNDEVAAVPPTPKGQPFAPHKACRVFPFPGFRVGNKITARTTLGPVLRPLTREALLSFFDRL